MVMLNLLHYKIEKNVHLYSQNNLALAYDVNSGSLHCLDEMTFAWLQEMAALQREQPELLGDPAKLLNTTGEQWSSAEKEEILEELSQLQKDGLLFSPEAEEVRPHYPKVPQIKALCLHLAHDCNLQCRYCFAGTGAFGGERSLMSLATGKKALDFLLERSGARDHCEVDFFGGEPLLNLSVLQDLVSYGREAAAQKGKRIKFTLTTNAILLDEALLDYLEQEEISVVLSLDGRPEINDRMRPFADGLGSYEAVLSPICETAARKSGCSPHAVGDYYYVRGTYTHYNPDFYRDVLHIADLGVNRISVEPVVADPDRDYALREEDMGQIMASYDILAEKVLEYEEAGKSFTFFHFQAGLDAGPCLPKRISGCGAGFEYAAVSPEGDIYPCHQFVGKEQYILGSVQVEETVLDESLVQAFRDANIYAKAECRDCWCRYSCSGGCHASNLFHGGGLNEVYSWGCRLQKKRLEIAYYLKARRALTQRDE